MPIQHVAGKHQVCRNSVYKQQAKAHEAINDVFDDQDDDKVLFYLPVTKIFIHQTVLSLVLICQSSYLLAPSAMWSIQLVSKRRSLISLMMWALLFIRPPMRYFTVIFPSLRWWTYPLAIAPCSEKKIAGMLMSGVYNDPQYLDHETKKI
jgi:hypothetical protein